MLERGRVGLLRDRAEGRRERGGGGCSTDDQETEGGGEREREREGVCASTGFDCWQQWREGGSSRLDGPSYALMEYGPGFRILPLP